LECCQLVKNDLNGAEESFNRSMEIDRNFGETHGGLAVVHVIQGKADIAGPEVKRALRLDPNSFAGRFAQSLLMNKTDPAKAQQLIQGILSSSPEPGKETLQATLSRMMVKKHKNSSSKK
jgi:Tfp pilus assembly protein PilF